MSIIYCNHCRQHYCKGRTIQIIQYHTLIAAIIIVGTITTS